MKKRWKKIVFIGLPLAIFFYTAVGFIVLPLLVKSLMVSNIGKATKRNVAISKVEINPYALSISVRGLNIYDHDNEIFTSFQEIYVNFQASSAFKRAVYFKELRIVQPYFRAILDKNGVFNFSDLAGDEGKEEKKPDKAEPEAEKGDLINVIVNELVIEGGKVLYADLSKERSFSTNLSNMRLVVNDFTIKGGDKSSFKINAGTEAGETFGIEGNFSVTPLFVKGKLHLGKIVLSKYTPYFYDKVGFELDDGILSVNCSYNYEAKESGDIMVVNEGNISLNSLRLSDRKNGENFLSVPSFSVKGIVVDVTKQKVSLDDITTASGFIKVDKEKSGDINLARVFTPPKEAKPEVKKEKKEEKKEKEESTEPENSSKPEKAEKKPPKDKSEAWNVALKHFVLEGYNVKFQDKAPTKSFIADLENIKIETGDLSFPPGEKLIHVSTSMNINQTGSLSTKASVKLEPLEVNLDVGLKDLGIVAANPYVSDAININLVDGRFNTEGLFKFALADSGDSDMSYTGSASINSFKIIEAGRSETLVKWDKLNLPSIAFGTSPMHLTINKIALNGLYSRLILKPGGATNMASAFSAKAPTRTADSTEEPKPDEKPDEPVPAETKTTAKKGEEKSSGFKFKFEQVSLSNSAFELQDQTIDPAYNASITGIETTIKQRSANNMEVQFKGKLNGFSPLFIGGRLNTTDYKNFLDIKAILENIDVSQFSPYTAKYVGRKLDKGKLSLNLKYKISRKQLEAENQIYINRLALGQKVESEGAKKLPLGLAVSLLQDRKGVIDIELPLSGDLNEPKASIGKIVIKALLNLITKLAASPFSIIGASFGGGEELSYVDFEPGSYEISENQSHKIDLLKEAMFERPTVSLEVRGSADPQADGYVIKTRKLNDLMVAEKRKELGKDKKSKKDKKSDKDSEEEEEELYISQDKYEKYLRQFYTTPEFIKPQTNEEPIKKPDKNTETKITNKTLKLFAPKIRAIAMHMVSVIQDTIIKYMESADLPIGVIEKAVLDNVPVTGSDLRELAQKRSETVQAYLLSDEKIEPARLYMLEPDISEADDRARAEDLLTRVNFSLVP